MDTGEEPTSPVTPDEDRRGGRAGLLRALRQGPGAGVAVVLGAAGLLFAASGSTAQGTDLRDDSVDLASLVGQERALAEGSTTLVESLRAEVAELEAGTAGADPELEQAVAAMSEVAGIQPVTGPAVRVVLDDADFTSRRAAQAGSPDDLVVHQQDVQAVVNALWLGGAEAMMLMDQRVISTSAVRCVGNTLSLQGQPYSPPYVITAVGDPEALLAALEASPTVDEYRRYVDAFGLGYDVDDIGETELPAYSGPLEMRFARVRDA
ncbi:DUF881 domain-containing protein [Jannaschia sp. R86511]|uniref:DUF881 domain-containing protein n=1 Tax=Jannaschia sp. R86511 TaxID=3093853 RepID=UPI0036D42A19